MKAILLFFLLTLSTTIVLAQNEVGGDTLRKIIPCNFNPSQHNHLSLKKVAEVFMKLKDVDCDTSDFKHQITSKRFVIANNKNTSGISKKPEYEGTLLKYKITVAYNAEQLSLQVIFIEGKNMNDWSKFVSAKGKRFASEIFDSWFDTVKKQICNL